MYYKVKYDNNKFIIIDVVDNKKNDNKFLYLTKDEVSRLKEELVVNRLKTDTTLSKMNF
jgi:hypothetical protein